jgi:hypothetical protein
MRIVRLAQAFALYWLAAPVLFVFGLVAALTCDQRIQREMDSVADVVLDSFAKVDR